MTMMVFSEEILFIEYFIRGKILPNQGGKNKIRNMKICEG